MGRIKQIATETDIRRIVKFFVTSPNPKKGYIYSEIRDGSGSTCRPTRLRRAIDLLVELGVLGKKSEQYFEGSKSLKHTYYLKVSSMLPIWKKYISSGLWNETPKVTKLELQKMIDNAKDSSNSKMITEDLNNGMVKDMDGEKNE